MIQYYLDLEKQVKNIKEIALSQGQIQKIYSTSYYISFAIRAPGKTWHLYFGRGGGFEGVWPWTSAPISQLRRKDNFLEYFRRHFSSCTFLGLSIDRYDRIVKFEYQKFGNIQSFFWFWKGRKLYFLHHYQDHPDAPFKILLSWRGKAFVPDEDILDLYDYFDEIGRHHDMNHDMVSSHLPDMGKLLDEELKNSDLKMTNSIPNFLMRKKENIENDLRKTEQWKKLQSILDKQENLDDLYELKVDDQKIKFEGKLNSFERRNLLFLKIKKLKRGESILKTRLEEVEGELIGKEKRITSKPSLPMIKPVWGEEKKLTVVSQKREDDFKVFVEDDYLVGVGTTAQGNDQLRNKWAAKDDLWLHLDGMKSSHAIIKMKNKGLVSPEIINKAASILAYFSQFEGDWIPVIYTLVKNLKGVSGAPGMVIYKKEKHLRCLRVNLENILKD